MNIADRLAALAFPDSGTWFDVLTESAAIEGSDLDSVLRKSQQQSAARARHRAWAMIKAKTSASSGEIGKAFDANPSTVVSGIRRHLQRPERLFAENTKPRLPFNANHPLALKLQRRLAGDQTWFDITQKATESEGANLLDVLDGKKTSAVCCARHRAWYEIRKLTSVSFPELGTAFDVRHTTVLGGVRSHAVRLAAIELASKEKPVLIAVSPAANETAKPRRTTKRLPTKKSKTKKRSRT